MESKNQESNFSTPISKAVLWACDVVVKIIHNTAALNGIFLLLFKNNNLKKLK